MYTDQVSLQNEGGIADPEKCLYAQDLSGHMQQQQQQQQQLMFIQHANTCFSTKPLQLGKMGIYTGLAFC